MHADLEGDMPRAGRQAGRPDGDFPGLGQARPGPGISVGLVAALRRGLKASRAQTMQITAARDSEIDNDSQSAFQLLHFFIRGGEKMSDPSSFAWLAGCYHGATRGFTRLHGHACVAPRSARRHSDTLRCRWEKVTQCDPCVAASRTCRR